MVELSIPNKDKAESGKMIICFINLPNKMSPVWHRLDRSHGSTALREFEYSFRAPQTLVKAEFLHRPVPTAGVDVVAVGRPARIHAPWRHIARRDAGNRVRLPSVPDPDCAVNRRCEEGVVRHDVGRLL